MAHLGVNHKYFTGTELNRGRTDHTQEREAIKGISGLLGSMALGPDPSDDALFYQRLTGARGNMLSNQGLESTLNARNLMSKDPASVLDRSKSALTGGVVCVIAWGNAGEPGGAL